ncbi:hypothetical protein NIES4102_17620 [Chondrocystis sp. NIES-4102]|nr:hypothetical protein NIES4102_17620 [Chondrocystis sp. NIES-4102]
MRQAIEFHFDSLKIEGLDIPQPTSSSAYVEIAAYHLINGATLASEAID